MTIGIDGGSAGDRTGPVGRIGTDHSIPPLRLGTVEGGVGRLHEALGGVELRA